MDYGLIDVTIGSEKANSRVYGVITVDSSKFNPEIDRHIWVYGLKQLLNDAASDKKDKDGNFLDDDAVLAKSEKKLDALYTGDLRKTAEPADPFGAECYRIAMADLAAAMKPKAVNVPKGTTDRLMFVINRELAKAGKPEIDRATAYAGYMAKNGKSVEKRATANMAERDKAAVAVTDLF